MRLLAAACYLGFDPFEFHGDRDEPFLRHHFEQASALMFGGVMALVPFLVAIWGVVRLTYEMPDLFIEWGCVVVRRVAFAFAAPAVVFLLPPAILRARGMLSALLGTWASAPFARAVAGCCGIARIRTMTWAARLALVALLVVVTIRAERLTRTWRPGQPAACYMLYEDCGRKWPHWLMSLGFYPVAAASTARFGPGSVVVAPFSEAALADALHNGRFVFLATHGIEGSIVLRDRWWSPEDVSAIGAGKHLQAVYITACYAGYRNEAWQSALAPARVVTYRRQSLQTEHLYWLFTQGPELVASLER